MKKKKPSLISRKVVEDFYTSDKNNINFWIARLERYDKSKVVSACLRSGTTQQIANEIANEIDRYADSRVKMSDIRPLIFAILQRKDQAAAKKFRAGEIYVRTSAERFERFNKDKIAKSIVKETEASEEIAKEIASEVENFIRTANLEYVSAPLVREIVNVRLLERNLEQIRGDYTRIGMPVFDITNLINIGDTENANLQYNPETIHKIVADNVLREYALLKVIPKRSADAHFHGLIHIHDLDYFVMRPFCFSHDLRFFLKKGFLADGQGIHTAAAGPAKHTEVAILHAAKILASAQTQCAGGQGYNWFNTILAPYVRGLDFKKMKQMAQMFLYEMAQMYVARGGQTVFSSIDIDPGIPKVLRDVPAVKPGGIVGPETYSDYQEEINQFFRALIEIYTNGDAWGKPFNFPKCEIKIGRDDLSKYREEIEKVSVLAAKFGTPYYFVQQDYLPEFSCYQSLPSDEKVFIITNDELKIVRIGEYVNELMKKHHPRKGIGIEGEVEILGCDDFVLSFDPENLKVEKRKIGSVMRHKTKEKIFRFVLDTNRKISATTKHKIFIAHEGKIIEVRAEDIKEGDFLIGLKDLKINFYFNDNIKYKDRKIKIDEDFARLLGYFSSEGYLHLANKKNRMNKIYFSFRNDEEEFVKDVERILKEKFNLDPKRDISMKNKTITVYVYDKFLTELFANVLKTGANSHTKRVPEKILSAPPEIIKEFLLGLFRGDGYFKNFGKKKIDLHLCNKELIEDVFVLSVRIGIPLNFLEGKKSHSLRLTSNKRINSFLQEVPFAQSPKNDGGLIRQFDFYERVLTQPFGITRDDLKKGGWNRMQIGKRITLDRLELEDNLHSKFAKSELHLFEVKKIEEVQSDYVYDFVDVDKYHNFANVYGIFSSNCCAYLMPLSEQNTNDDLYNGTVRGGALQVTTLNLPRLAYDSNREDSVLFELLRERMKLLKDVLLVKQKIIKKRLEQGLLPVLSQPVDNKGTPYFLVDKQALELGFVGVNEMCKFHTGYELHESKDAWTFGLKVIKAMTDIAKEFSAETGSNFTVSRTPAESCAYRLAIIDLREVNGKAIVQGDKSKGAVYYTNGNHVRPSADISLFERIKIESAFDPLLLGGTMSHVWLGESNPDPLALAELTEKIIKNTLIAYYAYTKDLTICRSCNSVSSLMLKECPKCNSKNLDWYSRITGYYQKVSGWNPGKQQELQDRRRYTIA